MTFLRWTGFSVGIIVVLLTGLSIGTTLIVPRRVSSKLAFLVGTLIRKIFVVAANRFESYQQKDSVLVLVGPAILLSQLFAWLTGFFLGYTLLLWPFGSSSLPQAMIESGSAMLTLGFSSPAGGFPTAVHFMAAATGLIVVALQIAYLPTLYSSFNRRETLVTTLQSRAGSPAWGPEILGRHHQVGLMGNLPQFFQEWERWSADVAESHSNYPVLIWFRSPHALRSWLVGLLAVMDAAAMESALNPSSAPIEGRLCIRMGFLCLREIAEASGVPYDPDPFPDDPIQLTFEEFSGAVRRLAEVGYPMERDVEEAWTHFRGWRVNYESIAYEMADLIVAPPGPWSGDRKHLPGLAILPQRPTNRTPDDARSSERPRGEGIGY